MITQEEYDTLVTDTWQQCKEDFTVLLESVTPKKEAAAKHNDKVQAMYENLIALRTVASIPHLNKELPMNTQYLLVTKPAREKQYIIHDSTLFINGKHLVTYTFLKEDATVFDTKKEAETYKDNINNPFQRVFSIENT
jgi:hypothetical protein